MSEPTSTLVVIPNVELAEVGMEWRASTGPLTITRDDLAAAVAALDDPAVHNPGLKFAINTPGHKAPLMLTFGRIDNLRTTNDGMTLVADIVGAPAWLPEVLPYAWPFRSIEGTQNDRTATGRTHLFRLTALALLGVELPAIETLDDVKAVFTATTMAEANVTLTADVAAARGAPMPKQVAASVSNEQVVRAWYSQNEDTPRGWWWVREVLVDPLALIVDDDQSGLWEVPVAITGSDITFGEATPVQVEYVPITVAASSAAGSGRRAIVFADKDQSRSGGQTVDPNKLREALGLPATATDDEVISAAAEAAARPAVTAEPPPAAPPATAETPPAAVPVAAATPPPGMVIISQAVLDELQEGAKQGVAASQTLAKQGEDAFIARHRRRIGASANPHAQLAESELRRRWQADAAAAETFAATLGVVVHAAAPGHESPGDDSLDADWERAEAAWFPEVAEVRASRRNTGGK